jgi:putative tryptophan/tyrosine transport system substrate-binding protein
MGHPALENWMPNRIRRREFITLLGGAAAAWPLAARAQQPKLPVVGFLHGESLNERRDRLPAFHRGLAELGYAEGRNVTIEYRWAEGRIDRLPALAEELVRLPVSVIAIPGSTPATLAAKAATHTIPIIFMVAADPVRIGLVTNLARPDGNLTGVTTLSSELGAKRLQLMRELVPTATLIAFLVNPANSVLAESDTAEMQRAARALGVGLLVINASNANEIETAFATMAQQRASALVVNGDAFYTTQRVQLAILAARHAVPTMYQYRENALSGGLVSYGTSAAGAYQIVGGYAGRILSGQKPSELPVQQPTKFEFVLNLRTARALGMDIPTSILLRADEVIE